MIKTYFYDHDSSSMLHDVDLNNTSQLLANTENLLWIDLYDCTEEELNYIGGIFEFHPLALEDCLQENPRAKIDDYEDYYFLVFHALRYFEEAEEEDEISSIELDVFLGPNFVVTIHPVALAAVGKAARISLRSTSIMNRGPDYLLYTIMDNIVDDSFPIMTRLGERIDDLEDAVFASRGQSFTEEILALKRTLILFRKVIIPQRTIITSLVGRKRLFVTDENEPYYLDLADNLSNVLDTVNTYRDLTNSSLEIYYSVVNGHTNQIITALTIISIIMMPLTVITGYFGMNVGLPMQGSGEAYLYILGGMLALSVSMLVVFRKKGWV